MPRKIRLKCPGCQVTIETVVDDQPRASLSCPACGKRFTAKLPPAVPDVIPAEIVQPGPRTPQFKPIPSATASQPPAKRPALRSPTVQRPANPYREPAPPAPQPDPLTAPLDFSTVMPQGLPLGLAPAYQPTYRRKPINLQPYFVGFGGAVGLVFVVWLGLFTWNWATTTDWSTFSLTPVSHQRLMDQMVAQFERQAELAVGAFDQGKTDFDSFKRRGLDIGQQSEQMLVRAVRLSWAPRDQQTAFHERLKVIDDRTKAIFEAKVKALREANPSPEGNLQERLNNLTADSKRIAELQASQQWQEAQLMTMAAYSYLRSGMFALPPPTNQPEQIYYEEAELVHEYLKSLAAVRRSGHCARAVASIDSLSEKALALAVRRSKLPMNSWEVVPREYVEKDSACTKAQEALIARIERDAQPDEALKDAVANFLDARQRILDASRGTSEVKLRDQFAQNKQKRAATTLHLPGDPFYREPVEVQRELVAKPGGNLAPEIALPDRTDAPSTTSSNTTSSNTAATNTAPSAALPPITPAPALASAPPANRTTGTDPVPTPSSPDSSHQPLGYRPPSMAPPSMISPGMARPGVARPGMSGPEMAAPSFDAYRPGAATPGNVSPGVGSDGVIMASPPPQQPEFNVTNSVKIFITHNQRDIPPLIKRLCSALAIQSQQSSWTSGTAEITLAFRGDLQNVVKAIDFGRVETVDHAQRTITVHCTD